jgi:hypothetical protein
MAIGEPSRSTALFAWATIWRTRGILTPNSTAASRNRIFSSVNPSLPVTTSSRRPSCPVIIPIHSRNATPEP